MEISGSIRKIYKTQSVGNNGFQKRELIIVTNEQYPQILLIEFVQDKCDLLNRFSIDDEVEISINLRGREWQNAAGEVRYFNTFQGWKIIYKNELNTPPSEPTLNNIEEDLPF
jgi:hypothetical protein